MNKRMWRQGDVLIMETEKPVGFQASRVQTCILVHGELTGHSHKAEGSVAVFDQGRTKFIEAAAPWELMHEEHATIAIPEGFYRVIRQREYDEEEIRYVRD